MTLRFQRILFSDIDSLENCILFCDIKIKEGGESHLVLSNTFTQVSLARELTRPAISVSMEGSRKWEVISAVHCCIDGQPDGKQTPQNNKGATDEE